MKAQELYIRTMQRKIEELSQYFPCVMVTGARQVGKSTLLREMLPPGMGYVTLDDYVEAEQAASDPVTFLERHGEPLCIDEVQYVPGLLRAIKVRVDAARRPGMYWLTGSQRFHMMKGVSESLAGRIGILELSGLSQWEMTGNGDKAIPFDPERPNEMLNPAGLCDMRALYERIWRGGYPQLIQYPTMPVHDFFSSYLQTYVERDVQELAQIGNKSAFVKLMRSAALRTGQQLVYSDLARDAGVTPKTAAAWISILEASGIVSLLQPYHVNAINRLSKSAKLYFSDTGFCAWLAGCEDAETLLSSHISGAMLETWVYGQLVRSYSNCGKGLNLYYFRNLDGAEVDFVMEKNHCLYPMEVKRSMHPTIADLKGVSKIPLSDYSLKPGIVFCTASAVLPLKNGASAFPISAL
ncbi:MAG: ATP-binding protein [Akkermansiaceae bacterium]|nr:ATP-binding protein [Akkermansiaceae bacterium]